MGTQIWPCRKKIKGQFVVIIWINLVDLESLLFTKIQPQSFLGSGEELFNALIYIYMGMEAILFSGAEPFHNSIYV